MIVQAYPLRPRAATDPLVATGAWLPGSKAAVHDPRWPRIAAALAALRLRGRRAIRIVDADCGAGSLLLHAVRHARTLGFIAVEARGIDGSPASIGRARAAANHGVDAAIGIEFVVADMIAALHAEHEQPADIVFCHGNAADGCHPAAAVSLRHAGYLVIGDETMWPSDDAAA